MRIGRSDRSGVPWHSVARPESASNLVDRSWPTGPVYETPRRPFNVACDPPWMSRVDPEM
jgi:hypothetical protein